MALRFVRLASPLAIPLFAVYTGAQITLPDAVPTSDCIGHPGATAKFTTTLSSEQGSQRIPAGDYWNQAGAVWEFSVNDDKILLSGAAIPGAAAGNGGDEGALNAQKALKINDNKKTMTLSVPSPTIGRTFDIIFNAGPQAPGNIVRRDHAITPAPDVPSLASVKFRAKPRNLAAEQVDAMLIPRKKKDPEVKLTVKANFPCNPSEPKESGGGKPDPTIASLCKNNKITPNAGSWKTYEVPKYLESLVSSASASAHIPDTSPFFNGIDVMKGDVNPPGPKCTYTAKCDSIDCGDVRDAASGKEVTAQRFLAYQSVINLNNYLWSIHDALYNAGTIASLVSGDLVKTFFTNPTPDATWMQIIGTTGSTIGMISGMMAPFTALGPASALFGAAASIAGAASSVGTINAIAPVEDKRFDENADIEKSFADFIKAADKGIQNAYDRSIGGQTGLTTWVGSQYAPDGDTAGKEGIFADGAFADSDHAQGMTDNILERMIKIMTYKAINKAWTDSGVFIMYVPYGREIMGPDGDKIEDFNADYCKNSLKDKDLVGKMINCDGDGMAAMFLAMNKGTGALGTPQGIDKKFQVTPDSTLNVMGAISGSVASWRKGDFNYDAGDPYKDAFGQSGLSAAQVKEVAQIKIQEDTPGFFNIPVCQLFDLGFFAPAMNSDYQQFTPCNPCDSKAAVGGKPGSTVKFMDKANSVVKDVLNAPNGRQNCINGRCLPACIGKIWDG